MASSHCIGQCNCLWLKKSTLLKFRGKKNRILRTETLKGLWCRFSVFGSVFYLFIIGLGDNLKDMHITFVDGPKFGRINY